MKLAILHALDTHACCTVFDIFDPDTEATFQLIFNCSDKVQSSIEKAK
jgi:hypothetical protein